MNTNEKHQWSEKSAGFPESNEHRYKVGKNLSVNHAAAPFMETGICFQESQVRKELRAAEIFISEIIKVTLALCCGWSLATTLRCFTFPAGDNVLHRDSHYPPTLKLDLDFWLKYFSDCLFQHISILPQTLSINVLPCLLQLKSKDFLKMDNTSVQFNLSWPQIPAYFNGQLYKSSWNLSHIPILSLWVLKCSLVLPW